MTAEELIRSLRERLAPTIGESAHLEARLLAEAALHTGECLSPFSKRSVTEAERTFAETMAERRRQGEPLQYILGEWEFMGLPFTVRPGVLIPRADTEILAEYAIELAQKHGYQSALDLCCGTGCIGISICCNTQLAVTLSDISPDCTRLARENAERNRADVSIVQGDLFAAVAGERFDLICCNPPYLTGEDMRELQREVTFEPALALYGGEDGLAFYRRIREEAGAFLNPNGRLLLEIGASQADDVRRLFRTAHVLNDYAGRPRVVEVEEI